MSSTATSPAIQFHDADTVLAMYKSRNIPAWAITQRTQFMFKYDGSDMDAGYDLLDQTLSAIESTKCIYTLKVYDHPIGPIKSNTPVDGSFNFVLTGENNQYQGGVGSNGRDVRSELQLLRAEIGALKTPAENSTMAFIRELLELPGVVDVAKPLLGKILGIAIDAAPAVPIYQQSQHVAGIPQTEDAPDLMISDELLSALTHLISVDKDFEAHMIQLSAVARKDPKKFLNLVGMIGML